MIQIEVGDVLTVAKGMITHYGVVVGRDAGQLIVAHADVTSREVTLVSIGEFAAGRSMRLAYRSRRDPLAVARRALGWLGKPYDLLQSNCEHLATYAATGRARSDQVTVGVGLAIVGGLMFLGSRPSYDPYVDRYRGRDGRFRAG